MSINERRKAGSMFDLILADEQWKREQTMNKNNSDKQKTNATSSSSSSTAQTSADTVINVPLFEKIYTHNTENFVAPSASRIFRPTMRYPPPPINFLIEDELGWCDLDEVSMDVHDFEYNFAQEDNWFEFLEIPQKQKVVGKTGSPDREHQPTPAKSNDTQNSKKDTENKENTAGDKLTQKELKKQLQRAMASELMPEETQKLCDSMRMQKTPKDPAKLGILPDDMGQLVNKNSLVAVEVLVYIANIIDQSSVSNYQYSIKDYLRVLIEPQHEEATINVLKSLEVVNRLTSLVTLPEEFLNLYISNLIDIVGKTKGDETRRLVRLVCIFIRSLFSTNVLQVVSRKEEGVIEIIQKFCVDNRQVPDSIKLFRYMKAQLKDNSNMEAMVSS